MAKSIFQTREQALNAAKQDAINQFENQFNVRLKDAKVINSDAWLVKSGSFDCECGETLGVVVTIFSNDITADMVVSGNLPEDEQLTVGYGYCDICGSKSLVHS